MVSSKAESLHLLRLYALEPKRWLPWRDLEPRFSPVAALRPRTRQGTSVSSSRVLRFRLMQLSDLESARGLWWQVLEPRVCACFGSTPLNPTKGFDGEFQSPKFAPVAGLRHRTHQGAPVVSSRTQSLQLLWLYALEPVRGFQWRVLEPIICAGCGSTPYNSPGCSSGEF